MDGQPLRRIAVEGVAEVIVSKATIVSAFEVATRGRHITAHVKLPIAEIHTHFVQLDPTRIVGRADVQRGVAADGAPQCSSRKHSSSHAALRHTGVSEPPSSGIAFSSAQPEHPNEQPATPSDP